MPIPANSVGVKTRFGAFDAVLDPGLAYAIPHVDEIRIVPTQRLLKLEFGFSTANATNAYQGDREPEDAETMITGDLNTALVPWVGIGHAKVTQVFCERTRAKKVGMFGLTFPRGRSAVRPGRDSQ